MAEVISLIGPGLDYETPADWWSDKVDDENPAQTGLMAPVEGGYSGFTFANMTNATPDADNHPRLAALPAYGHKGRIPANWDSIVHFKSEIIVRCPRVRFGREPGKVGAPFACKVTTDRAFQFASAAGFVPDHCVMDSLLIHQIDPDNDSGTVIQCAVTTTGFELTFNNIILYATGQLQNSTAEDKSLCTAIITGVENQTLTVNVNHWSVYCDTTPNDSERIIDRAWFLSPGHASNEIEFVCKSSAFVGSGFNECVDKSDVGTVTTTGSGHNLTSDETADDLLGGNGNLVNRTDADGIWRNPTANWRPKAGSPLIHAAESGVLAYDAMGRRRKDRPDIGAVEFRPVARRLQLIL